MGAVRALRVSTVLMLLAAGLTGAGTTPRSAFAAQAHTIALSPNGGAADLAFSNGATGTATIMALTTEQLTVTSYAGTFAANCDLQLTLVGPDASVLAGPACAGQTGSVSITAPMDGNYTAQLAATPGASGKVTLHVTSSGGPGSITPGASPGNYPFGPSDDLRLGFTASAGHGFSVLTKTAGRKNLCRLTMRLVDADGNQVGIAVTCNHLLDTVVVPVAGTYFVDIASTSQWRGSSVAPELFAVTDQTGPIPNKGVAVSVSLDTPGQNARFTFKGVVGNHISFVLTSAASIKECDLRLLRPDGSSAASVGACTYATQYGGFLEPFTLDQAGTWTIVVDPFDTHVGTATLQRYTVVDQTGTANLSGAPVGLDLTQPGQNARYTFSGTAGQKISAYLTNASFPAHCTPPTEGYSFTLVRPNGTTQAGGFNCSSGGVSPTSYIDTQTLSATGTWTVLVDPAMAMTGTATLQIFDVVDQTGAANLDGTPVALDLSAPGQNAQITFAGTTGQRVSTDLSSSTFGSSCTLTVLRPDNSAFAAGSCASPNDFIDTSALDATGTWTVVVDPIGPDTGTAALRVTNIVDQAGAITPGGSSVAINLGTPGQNAVLTFAGTTGDQRTVSITGSTFPGCSSIFVSLRRPDGTQRSIKGTCSATLTLGPVTLDATGTWSILVDPQGRGTGAATMSLT